MGSLFNGIWEEIKESTEENIENNIKKAWKKQNKDFYIHYIKKAYDIGEKRAQNVVEQVLLKRKIMPPETALE